MSDTEDQRLDIWLWRARFFKMRSDAAKAITSKGVRIDRTGLVRKTSKPGAVIAVGDILVFRKGAELVSLRILALPDRRGPASEAQLCYEAVKETESE